MRVCVCVCNKVDSKRHRNRSAAQEIVCVCVCGDIRFCGTEDSESLVWKILGFFVHQLA